MNLPLMPRHFSTRKVARLIGWPDLIGSRPPRRSAFGSESLGRKVAYGTGSSASSGPIRELRLGYGTGAIDQDYDSVISICAYPLCGADIWVKYRWHGPRAGACANASGSNISGKISCTDCRAFCLPATTTTTRARPTLQASPSPPANSEQEPYSRTMQRTE